jgi:signal transduction histidine kinase
MTGGQARTRRLLTACALLVLVLAACGPAGGGGAAASDPRAAGLAFAQCMRDNGLLERLIDGLLTLASSEQRIMEPTDVDMADIARHVTTESWETARSAGIDVRTRLRPAPVEGDPLLLERLAQNLVDNAIRYNHPGRGWIMVGTDVAGGSVHLTVENAGPPVQSYDVPGMFEPFRRLPSTDRIADFSPSSGPGAGLGLSIVRSVARAHGGDVHASPREEGGLTIWVRLPAASRGADGS